MQLPVPFIQLPVRYDATRLAAEIEQAAPEVTWRPHPQGFPGNSMLPLIAADGDPADESFAGNMQPTPQLMQCKYLLQVLASFGVTLGRTRLMRLAGHAEVTPHADTGYYWVDRVRVHVPVVTQPTVRFECAGAAVNMKAGECWIFNTWGRHFVLNDATESRIHLVCDTVGGEAFWNLVESGKPVPAPPQFPPNWAPRLIGFDENVNPTLVCENTNIPDVMTPWELATHLQFLLEEAGPFPTAAAAARAVSTFIRDWRALWARYGADAGHAEYHKRFETFAAEFERATSNVGLENETTLFRAMMAMLSRTAVGGRAAARQAGVAAMADNA
jgi:hypothetical protein